MPGGWIFRGPAYGWRPRGPGMGWGRGFFGRSPWCRGWGWAYYAGDVEFVPAPVWGGWAYAPDYQGEVEFLATRANVLKNELDMIEKRLAELESQKPEKNDE